MASTPGIVVDCPLTSPVVLGFVCPCLAPSSVAFLSFAAS